MPIHPAVADKKIVPLPEPLPAPVIDAHTHLDACGMKTAADVAGAMQRAASVGVAAVVTVGDDIASCRWAVTAANQHPDLYAAVAIHPTSADQLDDAARVELTELAADPRVVAIGETGLDFYWDAAAHDVQREAFAWHIELAKAVNKPLMIHDREAHEAIFEVLDAEGAPGDVIFHCFSGDAAMARRCADAGYVMSFAGPVSFKNARELADAARAAPLELILIETDAPFLTPHPHRGRRNEPYGLAYTARALAEIKQISLINLCHAVRRNTERVYKIPPIEG